MGMRIGVIGCGVISDIYLKNLTTRFSGISVVACADVVQEKSAMKAAEYHIAAMTPQELLQSNEVDVVLNLTNPQYHTEISLSAIENNKHVYSEKTLATSRQDAQRILAAAQEKSLRVGCAPDTFLGGGLQTAFKAIADGWIGRPLSATAFVTSRGHERWHPNPAYYYTESVGPQFDMGPYYITALVAVLGGVKRVQAMSSRAFDIRTISTGPQKSEKFAVKTDSHLCGTLEFESGLLATTIMSFDIWATHLPYLEIYGTAGTITLPNPNTFGGPVLLRSLHDDCFRELPLLYGFTEDCRGLGLAQMCSAIEHDAVHSASGALAFHVLDVLCSLTESAQTGKSVICTAPFVPPIQLQSGIMEIESQF